jgi:integrase
MLEAFSMKLKKEAGLSNRRINGILSAVTVPLHEAARLGLIESDPASGIRKLGNDTTEKGIPTSDEVRALVSLQDLDLRIRASIMLGVSCGLRAGEVQAIRFEDISDTTLTIRHSWSKFEGLKSTKTNRIRIVPLPQIVHDVLVCLTEANPHKECTFLIYGKNPDAPLDIRALERGFYSALEGIGIDETERNARNLSFHSLRHWNNSMLRGSVPDAKLRLLTGHSGEDMTNRYDHATEDDIRELSLAQERKIVPLISVAPIVG